MQLPQALGGEGPAPAAEVRPAPPNVRRLYDEWSQLVALAKKLPPEHRNSAITRINQAAELHVQFVQTRSKATLADIVDLLSPKPDDPVAVHEYLGFAMKSLAVSLMPPIGQEPSRGQMLSHALRAGGHAP